MQRKRGFVNLATRLHWHLRGGRVASQRAVAHVTRRAKGRVEEVAGRALLLHLRVVARGVARAAHGNGVAPAADYKRARAVRGNGVRVVHGDGGVKR